MDDGIRLQSQYECWEEKVQTANDNSYPVCSYVGLTKYALINKELKSFFSISYLY